MLKKVAVGVAVLVLLLSAVGFFWARSILATDTVRMALAAQISAAIGQPVTIRSIGAGIYPRVTVNLRGVTIGQPSRIEADTLRLGTDFRALLSRQIVHGVVRLDGARVELPLPPLFSSGTSSAESGSGGWPVEIVSIDNVLLNNVEVVSGGRTLRGDIEAVPHGTGLTLRKVSLEADDTNFDATGEITNLAGPVGAIDIKAGTLNLGRLLTFLAEFSSGFGTPGRAGSRQASRPGPAVNTPAMNVTVSLNANRATMGTLALERLMGKARVTREGVLLDPVDFGLFKGQYKGSLAFSLADAPTLRLRAALSNIDVAAAMAFAGSPGTLTGMLSGRLDLTSGGTEASKVIDGARGTARVDIKDGIVKNLGLVRTVVIATSMRSDAQPLPAANSNDERFSQLGATLAIANGWARTNDLQFESPEVSMHAVGSMRLDGSAIDLKGNVRLSEALSQQAGRDLFRYTQEQGRVTLPATVTGTAQSPVVRIDVAEAASRAMKNKINEEAGKAINKALGNIFKK
jgi:uncharacterized protein involved in outer membrane biogenesis